jgi:gamma-glutamylcysteine synthetase
MDYSQRWARHFHARKLSPEQKAAFERETRESIELQREIERGDKVSFDHYLDNYFAQYRAL